MEGLIHGGTYFRNFRVTQVLLERVWLPWRLNNQFSAHLLQFIDLHLNRIFIDEVFTKNGKTTRHYFGSLWNNSV